MGEMDQKYGQAYFGLVEEEEMPVRFNLRQQVDIMPGRKIFAEEYAVRTAKTSGKDYMQLRKVKLGEVEPVAMDLDEAEMDERDEEEHHPATAEGWTPPDNATVDSFTPDYEAGTNARWALKLSTDTYKSVMGQVPDGAQDWDTIESFAEWLLGAFGRLKLYKPKDPGYQNAKATARKIREED